MAGGNPTWATWHGDLEFFFDFYIIRLPALSTVHLGCRSKCPLLVAYNFNFEAVGQVFFWTPGWYGEWVMKCYERVSVKVRFWRLSDVLYSGQF